MKNENGVTRFPELKTKYMPFVEAKESTPYITRLRICFPNGFGASIIQGHGTYGFNESLFELGVLNFGELCYDTELTDNVIGYLDDTKVNEYLEKIMNLDREAYEKKKTEAKN